MLVVSCHTLFPLINGPHAQIGRRYYGAHMGAISTAIMCHTAIVGHTSDSSASSANSVSFTNTKQLKTKFELN